METRRTNKGGRPALADPAKHRHVLYLNDRENARDVYKRQLRYNSAPAEGGEVALSAASFPCRFRQEQVAVMVQKRAFIEMPFKTNSCIPCIYH